jgi:superfamily II DNA or RNA helicase
MDLIKKMAELDLNYIDEYFYNDYYFSYIFEYKNNTCVIIDDNLCELRKDNLFHYEKYCEMQNEYSNDYKITLRFLKTENIFDVVNNWLHKDITDIELKDKPGTREDYVADNSILEMRFEEIFQEAYGNDGMNYLNKEFGVSINKSTNAFIDYIVQTKSKSFAIEENGVNYHHPTIIGQTKYIKQLVRQNTLSLLGNHVFRFSTNNIMAREQMISNIKRFFGEKKNLVTINSIKNSRKFELYQHQKEYLKDFNNLRLNGVKTSLVVMPTAAGKSQIIISDLQKNVNEYKKILVMVPSTKIREDWEQRVKILKNNFIEIQTYNGAYSRRLAHTPDYYDYIVFDEAHHAQAPNCKKTIQYYNPKFLVGLTATPDRLDQRKITEIFGNYDTHLTLEEAIKKEVIANIRVFRLHSNIDLSEVRFNGKDYNNADIEKTLFVDSRNELIAETLKKYFTPTLGCFKQGLIFCVNVKHSLKLAKIIGEYGLSCEAVYGANRNNDKIFNDYKEKNIQFITTCQMISEGWDSPQTEVIVMARPTLSKVLYKQQLGRGARKNIGKECLYCIDVVDNYSAQLTPWSFNSMFHYETYTPWMGFKDGMTNDYLELLGLNEREIKLEEIDILTFEEKYPNIKSIEQTARELFVNTSTLKNWLRKDSELASLYLTVGSMKVAFFTEEDIEKIKKIKKIKNHTEETILKDFNEFIDKNSLTYSFKLIFLLSYLDLVDNDGECDFENLADKYKKFYVDRINKNLQVDRTGCVYTLEYLNDKTKLKKSILANPFEKYERKRFIYYAKTKDFNIFSFNPSLWKKLDKQKLEELKQKLNINLEDYYVDLGGL